MNLKSILTLGDRLHAPSVDHQAMLFPMQRMVDQMFGDLRFGMPPLLQGKAVPRMDVVETNRHIEVSAELPGLAREDIALELTNDTLVISGEKRREDTGGVRRVAERAYGAFTRRVGLPGGVEPGDVEATLDRGILTVKLTKAAAVQSSIRPIAIKAG